MPPLPAFPPQTFQTAASQTFAAGPRVAPVPSLRLTLTPRLFVEVALVRTDIEVVKVAQDLRAHRGGQIPSVIFGAPASGGGATWFSVLAGPFRDVSAAQQFCAAALLKTRGCVFRSR